MPNPIPLLQICQMVADGLGMREDVWTTGAGSTTTAVANVYPTATSRSGASNKAYEGAELYLTHAEASSTLAAALSATALSFNLASGGGAGFSATGPFVISIDEEWLLVTRSTDAITVVSGGRGYRGTRAAAHGLGTTVYGPAVTPNPTGIASYAASTGTFTTTIAWTADPSGSARVPFDIYGKGVSIWDLRRAVNRALYSLRYPHRAPLTVVPNGDMSRTELTGWTPAGANTTLAYSEGSSIAQGTRSLRVLAASTLQYAESDTIPVDPTNSPQWYVQTEVRADVGTARLIAYDKTNSATIQSTDYTSRGTGTIEFYFSLPATCKALSFRLMSVANTDDTYWNYCMAFPLGMRECVLPEYVEDDGQLLGVTNVPQTLYRADNRIYAKSVWARAVKQGGRANNTNPVKLIMEPVNNPTWIEVARPFPLLTANAHATFCDLDWIVLAATVELLKALLGRGATENTDQWKGEYKEFERQLKAMNSERMPRQSVISAEGPY